MKSSIKNFSSKSDQIRKKLRIWSHLMKKSLMQNFIFCTVLQLVYENLFPCGVIKYVAKTNNKYEAKTKNVFTGEQKVNRKLTVKLTEQCRSNKHLPVQSQQ